MTDLQTQYDAQTHGDGIGGTDGAELGPSTRRPIYRALLTYAELIACGMHDIEQVNSWQKAVVMLRAKGVPDACLLNGAPVRASEVNGGLLMEFE